MSGPQAVAFPGEEGEPPLPKRTLRRHFRSLRGAALSEAAPLILAAARRELPALLPAARHLGLYWPLPGEPDLRPLAEEHPALALPAVAGEPPRLLYRRWRPGAPLTPDRCGIPAPPAPRRHGASEAGPTAGELPAAALGLLLVPALAFDPVSGIRLGYGGGWYDRLRADPAWRAVLTLAVLPAAGLCPGLPRDPWDEPFQGWLDEHGLHTIANRPAEGPQEGEPGTGPL